MIVVDTKENNLRLFVENKLLLCTAILIGKNGATQFKQEGDGKTPLGTFGLGIVFGTHDRREINLDESMEYIKINPNLYWVDDVNSKYYNELVDITKVEVEWKSAEHLIEYPIQYEYAIEIKSNQKNIPGKGSAIFIHCSNCKSTAGCIAVPKYSMIKIMCKLNKNSKIIIK